MKPLTGGNIITYFPPNAAAIGGFDRQMSEKLDHVDIRILNVLQEDSSVSQRKLAEMVGLSQNALWRRLNILQKSGIIDGSTIKLNREKVELDLVVFVMVRTRRHSQDWLDEFRKAVLDMPEVVDFFRISGNFDYMIKVVTKDMKSYDLVYQKLIASVELDSVNSYFSMEAITEQRPLFLGGR